MMKKTRLIGAILLVTAIILIISLTKDKFKTDTPILSTDEVLEKELLKNMEEIIFH